MKEGISATEQGGGMIPGIHNLSSVGSSPAKRERKGKVDSNYRDAVYMGQGSAAGALSSKVNVKKVVLPAMDRELKYDNAS